MKLFSFSLLLLATSALQAAASPLPPTAGAQDTSARLELMKRQEAQGLILSALYQAAWLVELGGDESAAQEAARYLRQSEARGRLFLIGEGKDSEPVRDAFAALEARDRLLGSAARGTLATQKESLRLLLSRLAGKASQPSEDNDPVSLAARSDCLLAAEFAAEALSLGGEGESKHYLRQAVFFAEQLAARLPANARAWALLALARERLARRSGNWELTQQAALACEQAFALGKSSSLQFALGDLRGKLSGKLRPSEKAEETAVTTSSK